MGWKSKGMGSRKLSFDSFILGGSYTGRHRFKKNTDLQEWVVREGLTEVTGE